MNLQKEILNYLKKTKAQDINIEAPMPLVNAPVETKINKFISVENLPASLDDLPFIPERMRDFAFHYAVEFRSLKGWAKMYNVTLGTIDKWLRNPGVRMYIGLIRYQRRMYNFAMSVTLERNSYKALNDILTKRITNDTIGSILSAAKFVYNMLNGGPKEEKPAIDININNEPVKTETTMAYTEPRNVTPDKLHALKDEIDELEIVAKSIGVDID